MKKLSYFFIFIFPYIIVSGHSFATCKESMISIFKRAYEHRETMLKKGLDATKDDFKMPRCQSLYIFKNPSLLEEALTRRSFHPEKGHDRGKDNERLEFLGDSVVGLVMASILYEDYRKSDSDNLVSRRSHLVSNEFLAKMALAIELDKVTFASKEEMKNPSTRFFADTFEAYIGAIYEDSDYDLEFLKGMFRKIFTLL